MSMTHQPPMLRSLSLYVTCAGVLLMAPIVIVIILSFGEQSALKFPPDSFGLRWFNTFFSECHCKPDV